MSSQKTELYVRRRFSRGGEPEASGLGHWQFVLVLFSVMVQYTWVWGKLTGFEGTAFIPPASFSFIAFSIAVI